MAHYELVNRLIQVFDEEEMLLAEIAGLKRTPRTKKPNHMRETVTKYTPDDFSCHFGMSRSSVQILIDKLTAQDKNPRGHPRSIEDVVLMGLWTLVHRESLGEIAERFGTSKSGAHTNCYLFCSFMKNSMGHLISWPEEPTLSTYPEKFRAIANFPGVVGIIDSTHVNILAPPKSDNLYVNGLGLHSINLTAVCGPQLKFMYLVVGYPGSYADAQILKSSDLWGDLNKANNDMVPQHCHLLGDSKYPLETFLMVPFEDNVYLREALKSYNLAHSRTRRLIDTAFGLLKTKFKRLKGLEIKDVNNAVSIVHACCVLHNFCIDQKEDCVEEVTCSENIDDIFEESDDVEPVEPSSAAVQKRLQIAESCVSVSSLIEHQSWESETVLHS